VERAGERSRSQLQRRRPHQIVFEEWSLYAGLIHPYCEHRDWERSWMRVPLDARYDTGSLPSPPGARGRERLNAVSDSEWEGLEPRLFLLRGPVQPKHGVDAEQEQEDDQRRHPRVE
jgi:hypothetical protein